MDEAKRELAHIGSILERCMFYLKEAGTEVEFSNTGRTVQQVLDNMVTRLAVQREMLPVQVTQVIKHETVSLREERFYKLGAMLTKVVQEASRLEEPMEELYAHGKELADDY